MKNCAEARKNMIDCQLEPNGITSRAVLEAFNIVPRELFLPKNKQGVAYLDEDIVLDKGKFCMEPVVLARMVQAARPGPDDAVLNIGDVTGYSSAIFSSLVSTVVTLESELGTLDEARKIWDKCDFCNIAVVKGKEPEGAPQHAPYNLIFLNGAVAEVPESLLEQLADGARIVAVLRENPQGFGRITVFEKVGERNYSSRRLYDAATPYIKGLEPGPCFVF